MAILLHLDMKKNVHGGLDEGWERQEDEGRRVFKL